MAKTSFGSTDLKKVSIGGTTIKKISIGETIVYTSAEPFYIVQDGICKQTITWTRVDSENENVYTAFYYTHKWEVGKGPETVKFLYEDDSKSASATYESSVIETKGNSTLYIDAGYNDSYDIRINSLTAPRIQGGHTCDGDGREQVTIDISGYSTIKLYVDIHCLPYNNAYFNFSTMRLY